MKASFLISITSDPNEEKNPAEDIDEIGYSSSKNVHFIDLGNPSHETILHVASLAQEICYFYFSENVDSEFLLDTIYDLNRLYSKQTGIQVFTCKNIDDVQNRQFMK